MGTVRRNLAFYKRSGEPWTQKEFNNIRDYCGSKGTGSIMSNRYIKFIFDDAYMSAFMHAWSYQQDDSNFKNCKQVAYEDIFNEDGTVKGEQMEEEVVTVNNKGELIDLLRSGGKWTSDEFCDKTIWCEYDESFDMPFITKADDGCEWPMSSEWNIKTWRKVNPQFKRGDLVVCWDNDDDDRNGLDVRVWNETGVFKIYKKEGNTVYDHYEPYTGTVPKHLQDFIDEMKAKE